MSKLLTSYILCFIIRYDTIWCMKCPFCGNLEDKVVDSREAEDGLAIRRRRECLKCARRFTTYEEIEERPLLVIKRDGRREPFDRKKLEVGVLKACEKRPIPFEKIEAIIDRLVRELRRGFPNEVNSKEIGERVIKELRKIDEVAYVRFASVYRQFKDAAEFTEEVRRLGKFPKRHA